MAELLSSASAWVTGSGLATLNISSSSLNTPIRGAGAPALLEVALPFGPSSQREAATGPVHYMGGGPRTYPGGVTKWQWKRMQLKKSRQMEKARLMREKHVYEARRRAELIAATPILEMPWQKMSRVRPPNYVSADEQITKLAARFHKPGAEDLWTENDGPERFEGTDNNDDRFDSQSSPWLSSNSMTHSQQEVVGRPATKEEYIEARDRGTANLLQRLKQEGVVLLAPQGEQIETELEYAVGENGEQVEDEDEDEDNTYVPSEEDESEDEDLESELDAQDENQDNVQGAMYAKEQKNGFLEMETPPYPQSFRYMPRIKPGSTPYLESNPWTYRRRPGDRTTK